MPATQNVTKEQMTEMFDLQQDLIIKFFNNQVEKLEKKLEVLNEENNNLRAEVIELKSEVNGMKTTVEFVSAKYDEVINNVKPADSGDNTMIRKLKSENEEMLAKVTELEDRSRRNNLRFDGISEVDDESWEESERRVKLFISNKLNIDTDKLNIERCHRVGPKREGRNRTIICKFLNYKNRDEILNKYVKEKLWLQSFYVNEDFCAKTVEVRKRLFAEVKQQREQGKK